MNPIEYIRALRRRWVDVALSVLVALVAGWLITSVAPAGPPLRSYEATSLVVSTGTDSLNPGIQNLATLAALTTVGEVPNRVAAVMKFQGDPVELAANVRAAADQQAGVLKITATGNDETQPVTVANLFARELLGYLTDQQTESASKQADNLQARLDRLEREIAELDREIPDSPADEASLLRAQRDAKVRQYGLLYEAYQQIAFQAARGPGGLQIIDAEGATAVSTGGIQAPRSRTSRLVLAGVLGLIGGVIIVLFLERFDTKIRTKQDAERFFDQPVLAEIPFVPRRKKVELGLVSRSSPRSYSPDAFRILAAMLSLRRTPGETLARSDEEAGPQPAGNGGRRAQPPRTILVTSPGPADGKTTIVANLAQTFAGVGRSVIVLSCDFRRPKVHRLLGMENGDGLTEALRPTATGPVLDGLVRATAIPRVSLVTSGGPVDRPGDLLSSDRMRRAIAEASERADVVIIDTPPILTTSDAAGLIPEVEAVVMVARAGRTSGDVAERTRDLMRGLAAPVVGVALNATTDTSVPRRYYYYSYSHEAPKGRHRGRGLPRLIRSSKAR